MVAAEMLECSPDDIVVEAPRIYCRSNPDKETTWNEVVEQSFWLGIPLQEFGYYRAPRAKWEEETGRGEPYITYTFGAIVTELTVDTETGQVFIDKAYIAYDIGRVINPVGAEHHAEGGYIQGMGYALMEELLHSKEGLVYNPNLSTYYIPTIKDTPREFHVFFVESGYKRGPFGAKGLGEPSIVPVAPSIVNALSHALGIRFNEIPLPPHKIYLAIKKHGLKQ